MGFRYRKSINLGGGFRINLSKSGIGYSWGFPGYRHTISANGSQRKTYSIPGTGISYVDSFKNNNREEQNNNLSYNENEKLITGNTIYYQNVNISHMGKDDEILIQINKLRIIDIIANLSLISIFLIPIGILLKFLIANKWKIDLTYEMDDVNNRKFVELNKFLQILQQNKKIWQINSSIKVYNTKYNAGAGNNVSRHMVHVIKKMPWYIIHNVDIYCLVLTNEKIYFTPDRMLIFKNFGGVGCKKYNDLIANFDFTDFVETEFVPSDAQIVRHTWRYVNKSGGPDKRFSDNKSIPICKYGEISLSSDDGLNILLECSNHKLVNLMKQSFMQFISYHNQIVNSKNYLESYDIENYGETIQYNQKNNSNNSTNNIEEKKEDKWNTYNNELDE